jgi:acyl-CoA thioesterase FadM
MDILQRGLRYLRLSRRTSQRLGVHDVASMPMRVWASDLDELRHMNNGVYLTAMDLPRFDLMRRAGIWQAIDAAGYYPVVVAQTISYRKSLTLGQRYDIETRMIGYDEKSAYCEQRFVVAGEIYARAYVRARFLKRGGGAVSMREVADIAGIEIDKYPIPEWMRQWAEHVALPPTKAPAPSEWPAD